MARAQSSGEASWEGTSEEGRQGVADCLYCGDNLEILRDKIASETIDLIYLDPPFNSSRTYNLIFKDESGQSEGQMLAFKDTWNWGESAKQAFEYLTNTVQQTRTASVPEALVTLISAIKSGVGTNPMSAYLVEMAVRLLEMHRVLKPTGSLYFHCDPRASHYLKLVLDTIFGHDRCLAEVIWKRTSAHSSAKRPGPVHDVLLVYTKTKKYVWNQQYQPYDPDYIDLFFEMQDADGRRWKRMDLTGAGVRHGATGEPWRGINITAKGRHWAYRPSKLDALEKAKKIHWPEKANGMPRLKQYVDEMPGVPLQDVWTDIKPIHNLAVERVGFQTQKPVALLKRIIEASSNPGDVVLDPFCGCGTAVVAARKLKRDCIGIDIAWLAIAVIRSRVPDIPVINEPKERRALLELAHSENGGYKVQQWALQKVHAAPVGGGTVVKKGRDRGVDGVRFFTENGGFPERILYSVKSGKVGPRDIRELRAVIDRDKAAIGILITLQKPTPDMKQEAVDVGYYASKLFSRKYRRLQIVTTDQLLAGTQPDIPLQLARTISAEAPALIDPKLIEAPRRDIEQLTLPVGEGSLDLIDKRLTRKMQSQRKERAKAAARESASRDRRPITKSDIA